MVAFCISEFVVVSEDLELRPRNELGEAAAASRIIAKIAQEELLCQRLHIHSN